MMKTPGIGTQNIKYRLVSECQSIDYYWNLIRGDASVGRHLCRKNPERSDLQSRLCQSPWCWGVQSASVT